MIKKLRPILIFAGVIILAMIAYSFFKKLAPASSGSTLATTSSVQDMGTNDVAVGGEFVTMLLNLRTISLDDSILHSPTFTGLKDFSIVLTQLGNQGRPNPFAPFGVEATSPTNTNSPVITNAISGITTTGAALSGAISAGTVPSERWFEWGTTDAFGNQTTKITLATSPFSATLTGLVPATNYYVRAVATVNGQIVYGNQQVFKTLSTTTTP